MTSDAAGFLVELGIGPVERRIRLIGTLPAESTGPLAAELCLGANGAWVVATAGRFVGRAVDASDPASVRYERGRLRDRLVLGGTLLTVPAGKARQVRTLLALGRLRRAGHTGGSLPASFDRYHERIDEPAQALAAALCGGAEALIALVTLHRGEPCVSELGADVSRSTYLLLAADALQLFSVSELGDVEVRRVAADDLGLSHRDGEARLGLGDIDVPVAPRSAARIAELLEIAKLPAPERLHEAARRLWLGRKRDEGSGRVRDLLRAAAERGHTPSRFALALVSAELQGGRGLAPGLPELLQALRASALPADALTSTFQRWEFSPELGRTLVTLLSAFGAEAEPWAVTLHRALHASRPDADATADLELAEHELATGEPTRARALAAARLEKLGPDDGAGLVARSANPTQLVRQRLHDVLRREAERRGEADVRALAALARLDPSNPARLTALSAAASASPNADERRLGERAARVLAALEPEGLDASAPGPTELPEPLRPSELEERVRHPLARGSGRIAARLSELVAATPEPDLGFLRDFCEELSSNRHPDAARALGRAARLLGLGQVRAYVSHGARSVGTRVFGAREPFVLIGQSHLVDDGPLTLRGAELDFALTAELSHLAFGHQRVTAAEVLTGAAGKTRDALVALGVVLPFVGELGGPRAQRVLARLTPEALARAAEGALKLEKWFGTVRARESGLAQRNEELIAAHRLVQLSADRAGLIAAGDLVAAFRAMLLSRSEYHELLAESRRRGLLVALGDERTDTPARADLRVRLRALIAFYLSSDFDVLTARAASSGVAALSAR